MFDVFHSAAIPQPGGIGLEHPAHFVSDTAEAGENFLLTAGGLGRIVKRPVMTIYLAGENRAGSVRVAADGDDGVDRPIQKFLQGFRAMTGNVNARLGHDLDGQRMNLAGRIRAGALDVHEVACRCAQKSLGHVAATGVAGAENENEGLHFGRRRREESQLFSS